MDQKQAQLVQAFMLDLGIVLGAKSEQEALQTGQAAIQKLGENASKLFQAWGQAEAQQQGAGKQIIAQALGENQQKQTIPPQTIGSMSQTYNAAPTPTPYGDTPRYAKLGTKLSKLNGHCPEGYEVEKYLAGGCVKCRRGKQLQAMAIKSKKRFKKEEGGEMDFLKCGGKKAKKHLGGGIIDQLKNLIGYSKQQNSTVSLPQTPIQETNDTKYGVQRLTSNTTGDGYIDGSFFEGYRGQNGSWADITWPDGQGKGKKRIVTESNPGVADSLSYRYFNRTIPSIKKPVKPIANTSTKIALGDFDTLATLHKTGGKTKVGKFKNANKVSIIGSQGMFDYGKI